MQFAFFLNKLISLQRLTIECVQNISKILGDPLAQFAEILLQEQIDNVYKVNFPQMDELK